MTLFISLYWYLSIANSWQPYYKKYISCFNYNEYVYFGVHLDFTIITINQLYRHLYSFIR